MLCTTQLGKEMRKPASSFYLRGQTYVFDNGISDSKYELFLTRFQARHQDLSGMTAADHAHQARHILEESGARFHSRFQSRFQTYIPKMPNHLLLIMKMSCYPKGFVCVLGDGYLTQL